MALKKLTIAPLEIPFKTGFKHHSAERKKTQSVLVKAESENGAVGWGESCPREYVTGEDVPGCLDFFTRHQSEMASIKDRPMPNTATNSEKMAVVLKDAK